MSTLLRLLEDWCKGLDNRECIAAILMDLSKAVDSRGGGVGGGTLIFAYTRRLGSFFGVQNFEFQYFSGFSEK